MPAGMKGAQPQLYPPCPAGFRQRVTLSRRYQVRENLGYLLLHQAMPDIFRDGMELDLCRDTFKTRIEGQSPWSYKAERHGRPVRRAGPY